MPVVKMPDGTQVQFPDDMPKEQIRDMIATKFPELAPQPEQFSNFRSALEGAGQGLTFNWSDEIEAGLRAPFSDKSYSELQKEVSQRHSDMASEDPFSYYGGLVGSSLAVPGLGAVKAVKAATSGLGKIATGGLVGAAEGALGGAGMSDPGERGEGAAIGGAIGAPLGVVGGTVADMIRPSTQKITSKVGIADTPLPQIKETVSESIKSAAQRLKGKERAAWDMIDQSSGQFDQPGVALYLRENMKAILPNITDPDMASYAEKLLTRVIPDSEGNKAIGLKDLSNYRKALNRAFSPSNPDKNRVIADLKAVLDDDMVKLTNSVLYKGSPDDVQLIKNAKDLTREYKQLYRDDKILKSLVDENANPDNAINFLFHVNSITRNKSAVNALEKIRKNAPETMEALKQAGWQRITTHADGTPREAKDIQRFISEMNLNNNQLSKKLFGSDWEEIRKLPEALKRSSDNSRYSHYAKKFGRPTAMALTGTPIGGAAWFGYSLLD